MQIQEPSAGSYLVIPQPPAAEARNPGLDSGRTAKKGGPKAAALPPKLPSFGLCAGRATVESYRMRGDEPAKKKKRRPAFHANLLSESERLHSGRSLPHLQVDEPDFTLEPAEKTA
ncbi:MAG: hypothetical protein AB1651_08315 [Pseudomonadota bacterium]